MTFSTKLLNGLNPNLTEVDPLSPLLQTIKKISSSKIHDLSWNQETFLVGICKSSHLNYHEEIQFLRQAAQAPDQVNLPWTKKHELLCVSR